METNASTKTRDRSYTNRVARGDSVAFVADHAEAIDFMANWNETTKTFTGQRLVPGETYTGVVLSESNAGFRGIEMSVKLDDDLGSVHGVSTGTIVR